ncbi:alpha/beta hydrolase family protein [Arthrobacter tumbae]|uniref:alpha/beta hydrolase family protein n=1 Tax=Arthrobacter tumbae TaxID=163874 RepID=UPI0019589899|nr:alpha/beta hydrolase [Arthrobacter tumbae]MBM7781869.1 pimeloyl-ACP methyl ester carboxylesterase [Arthrobacter tumbae]
MLMHPGSGPSDRNNDSFFPPIRTALLEANVAVVSFDKRGVGGSEGDWRQAGIELQADDLCACLRAAREFLPDIPAGIFGHSQGGWVVVEAASRSGADFAITSSGPAVSPNQQELFAATSALTAHGLNDEQVTEGIELYGHILEQLSNGQSFASFKSWAAAHREPVNLLESAGVFIPGEQTHWDLAASMGDYDPQVRLLSFDLPLLAVFGSEDSVVPVQRSISILRRSVPASLLQASVISGGNHRMQRRNSGDLAAGYLETVLTFIENHS